MIDHAESVRNFYRKQGAKAEQQPIIELLEKNDHYSVDWLIELIKGESQNDNETVVILTEGETNA